MFWYKNMDQLLWSGIRTWTSYFILATFRIDVNKNMDQLLYSGHVPMCVVLEACFWCAFSLCSWGEVYRKIQMSKSRIELSIEGVFLAHKCSSREIPNANEIPIQSSFHHSTHWKPNIVLSSLKIETIVDKVLFLADSLFLKEKIVKTQVWVRGTRSTCVSSSTIYLDFSC